MVDASASERECSFRLLTCADGQRRAGLSPFQQALHVRHAEISHYFRRICDCDCRRNQLIRPDFPLQVHNAKIGNETVLA